MYKLKSFPSGKFEKKKVSCIKIEMTNELTKPIIFAKNGIKLNGINATLNHKMTADNGMAKILANKK